MDQIKLQQLRYVFNVIDTNRDHLLNPQELHAVMGELGRPVSYYQVEDFIRRFDRTGDRMLNFNEFVQLYNSLTYQHY